MIGAGQMREQIRMAVPRITGQAQCFLVNRRGGDRGHVAALSVSRGSNDRVVRRMARRRRQDAGLETRVRRRAVQHRLAHLKHTGIGGGAARTSGWAQIKAAVLERPVATVGVEEPGVFGAALAAFVGIHSFKTLADAQRLVRVAPEVRRSVSSGPEGLRLLCVGGVPGAPYEPPEWSEPR